MDLSGAGGVDPDPTTPRNKICRLCAREVLLYGLRDWWEREKSLETSTSSQSAMQGIESPPFGSQVNETSATDEVHGRKFIHILPSIGVYRALNQL